MNLALFLAGLCLSTAAIADVSVAATSASPREEDFGWPLVIAGLANAHTTELQVVVVYTDGRVLYRRRGDEFSYVRLTRPELAVLMASLPVDQLRSGSDNWAPYTNHEPNSFVAYYPSGADPVRIYGYGDLTQSETRALAPAAVAAVFTKLWAFHSVRAVSWAPSSVKVYLFVPYPADRGTLPAGWPCSQSPCTIRRVQIPEIERYGSTLDRRFYLYIRNPYPRQPDERPGGDLYP